MKSNGFPPESSPLVVVNAHVDVTTAVSIDPDSWSIKFGDSYNHAATIALYLGTGDDQAIDMIENVFVPNLQRLADALRRKSIRVLQHQSREEPNESDD